MVTHKKQHFVKDLKSGQQFEDVFLVARKNLAETKAGKPYLALTLMDRSGEIEARLWDNALNFADQAEEGNFIRVLALTKSYRDQVQLNLEHLQRVERTEVDAQDFVLASARASEDMLEELNRYISMIEDEQLRGLLQTIFQGETLERFQRAPAAKKMHHAYLGGLLEHTLSVAGMALRAAEHYPSLDKDMLLAGALLHDLAKIDELDYSTPAFQYTDRGRLLGHITIGVEMIRQAASRMEEQTQAQKIPEERLNLLSHIILSHHGQLMFGSPVLPMTPEAILLHHLDDIDAKMNHMDSLRAKMENSGWQWTDYQRHLERYLYLRGEGENKPEMPEDREPCDLLRPPGGSKKADKSSMGEGTGKTGVQQQSLF